ncbi:MAG: alpha-amylase, partial [Acidobacteriota bacterium]|nr:alpha-amylase [Acidobacteriota bacterium]
MPILPMNRLGARETAPNVIDFGVLLPRVDPSRGTLAIKILHENDQFLKNAAPVTVPMTHSIDPQYGDYWSASIDIRTQPGSGASWGTPGRYVYRYVFRMNNGSEIDWIIDPCAREFGIGKLSAITVGYRDYVWSANEAQWRTPHIHDLVIYELMIQEFGGTIDGTIERLPYLADLGVNCLEIMPLSNVAESLDWGFLPLAHFGVDERFGNRGRL